MVSDVRRRVAERWSQVDYRADGKKFATKKQKLEVIDLTKSDSNKDNDSGREYRISSVPCKYPFKLVKSDVFDRGSRVSSHLIDLKEVFQDHKLRKSFLFSFQYELDFLLEQFHSNVQKIILVAQEGTVLPPTTSAALAWVSKIRICRVCMPPFACHHSKMIINIYQDESLQLFMPSNNFTHAETNYPQQVCWMSPRLFPGTSEKKISFQSDFLDYLQSYGLSEINRYIIPEVKKVNFQPLQDTEFIYSTPSKHYVSGFRLLVKKLPYKGEGNSETHHYLCQSSSVANSLSKKESCNIFTHMMIPALEGIIPEDSKKLITTSQLVDNLHRHHIIPYLVYPTVQEIVKSPVGFLCSGWFNFNYEKDMAHYNVLKNELAIFHKQDIKQLSIERGTTPSHSKFYIKSTTRSPLEKPFEELDWCLFTSSNLSFSAWGKTSAKPRNYEAGILLKSPDLHCQSFVDLIYNRRNSKLPNTNANGNTVTVPWTFNLIPYEKNDQAFCISKHHS